MEVIAHNNKELGISQDLKDHLLMVANLSKGSSKFPNMSYVIGLVHDLGKSDPYWQGYIRGKVKGKVKHSDAGAKYLMQLSEDKDSIQKLYLRVMAYVVSSHHGQYNNLQSGNNGLVINYLEDRIKYDEVKDSPYNYGEVIRYTKQLESDLGVNIGDVIGKGYEEFKELIKAQFPKISGQGREAIVLNHFIGVLVRYLLSILKTSDIYDTITWDKGVISIDEVDWGIYVDKIEDRYLQFKGSDSELNKVRMSISDEVLSKVSSVKGGIIKLDLPTGAGKTLTALRYALHSCKLKGYKRIFYVAPFLSVLEQNAREIRNVIGNDDIILEHHSNYIKDDSDDEVEDSNKLKGLDSIWSEPIVLTTLVQFINTLYGVKSDNFRRFSYLQDSILIFDEIQSLPMSHYHLFNLMLNRLSDIFNCHVITCSATQPYLEDINITYPLIYNREDTLIQHINKDVFKRTEDRLLMGIKDELGLVKHISGNHSNDSVLVVLNSKKGVSDLYDCLKEEFPNKQIYYLSTNLYPKHRLSVIQDIKERLSKDEDIIVVSTNLIEAGVDLDFGVVYRNISSASSLVQSRGRCNRNGLRDIGYFYVINIVEEAVKSGKLKEVSDAIKLTNDILPKDRHNVVVDIDDFSKRYYDILYKRNKHNNAVRIVDVMDTPIDLGYETVNLLDEFSVNEELLSKVEGFKKYGVYGNYKTVGDHIGLIKNDGYTVIVETDDNKELINNLRYKIGNNISIYNDLKSLQVYTITIYLKEYLETVCENLGNGVYLLLDGNYDTTKGFIPDSSGLFTQYIDL